MFLTFLVTRHDASTKKQLFTKRYHHPVVNRRSETKNTRIARNVWPVIQQAARRYELLEASNILITFCIAYHTLGLKRLRSSSSFVHLLPCLPVTSIPPCIFPSKTRCRKHFLGKMWPIQFAFRLRISCRRFLCSLTLSNTFSFLTWSIQMIFSILLQHHISKLSRCFWSTSRSVQVSAPYKAMLQM